MSKEVDWRLENMQDEDRGKALSYRKFTNTALSDHDHCVLCWQKISQLLNKDSVGGGYILQSNHGHEEWICPKCFKDFAEQFNWSLKQ